MKNTISLGCGVINPCINLDELNTKWRKIVWGNLFYFWEKCIIFGLQKMQIGAYLVLDNVPRFKPIFSLPSSLLVIYVLNINDLL